MKSGRRKARTLALQVLYELDLTGHAVEAVIQERQQDADLSPDLLAFAQELIHGTLSYRPALDQMIHRHAPEWPFDQMAIIDRNILRLAIWEFALYGQTPVKVAINEAVELAKRFGAESSPAFVNGVLGALAAQVKQLREDLANYRPPANGKSPRRSVS